MIRVQLRDRNPPRAFWRPGRGRGRSLFNGPPMTRGLAFEDSLASVRTFPPSNPLAATPSSLGNVAGTLGTFPGSDNSPAQGSPAPSALHGSSDRIPLGLQGSSTGRSSISSTTTKVSSLRGEVHRGVPGMTMSPASPTPSTVVSTSAPPVAPAPPYPINMGFLPSPPWLPPYATPYPYAVPIIPGYGYPGFPYPPIPTVPPSYFSQDAASRSVGNVPSTSWSSTTPAAKVCSFDFIPRHVLILSYCSPTLRRPTVRRPPTLTSRLPEPSRPSEPQVSFKTNKARSFPFIREKP